MVELGGSILGGHVCFFFFFCGEKITSEEDGWHLIFARVLDAEFGFRALPM